MLKAIYKFFLLIKMIMMMD